MALESLIVLIIVGAIAGWLAGQIVKGMGFGLIGNIVVGIAPSSAPGCSGFLAFQSAVGSSLQS
jgi:uncharacterized membrane protein YeaQ/YmgE (transglycosylase-associated protein family)